MRSKNVLLIGGAGFIGSRIAQALCGAGHRVWVMDAFLASVATWEQDATGASAYRYRLLESCEGVIQGNARIGPDVGRAFALSKPDLVVHLAAVTRAPLNDSLPCEAIEQLIGIPTVLSACSSHCVSRYLYVSSSYVYGDFTDNPCTEAHPTRPNTVYGVVKLAGEGLTRSLARRYEVPFTIVRPIAVYGPGDVNGKLSCQNLASAIHRGYLPIGGTAEDERDYTYVDDAAGGIIAALLTGDCEGRTLNVSHGRTHSTGEILRVLACLGYPNVSITQAKSVASGAPKRGGLSNRELCGLTGWRPRTGLKRGLTRCIDYVMSKPALRPNGMTGTKREGLLMST